MTDSNCYGYGAEGGALQCKSVSLPFPVLPLHFIISSLSLRTQQWQHARCRFRRHQDKAELIFSVLRVEKPRCQDNVLLKFIFVRVLPCRRLFMSWLTAPLFLRVEKSGWWITDLTLVSRFCTERPLVPCTSPQLILLVGNAG
jgi:hypothetical protein